MKKALVSNCQSHEKSYLSWNKDTVKRWCNLWTLIWLSDGKLNLIQSSEELLNTTDLLRTNKRVSNKIAPIGQPKILSNKN
jgi:hypothetical protein